MTKQLIIDTDPGPDDEVAILTALGSPLIDVLGVCAIAGNVPLRHTVRNVRKILELAERQDVKVFAGAEAPLDACSIEMRTRTLRFRLDQEF
jgi:purine nucleosidase